MIAAVNAPALVENQWPAAWALPMAGCPFAENPER
jgi:hypothetical protein